MSAPGRPAISSYFAGSRRLQSDLLDLTLPQLTAEQCAFLAEELAKHGLRGEPAESLPDEPLIAFCELVSGVHASLLITARFIFPESAELVDYDPAERRVRIAVPRAFHRAEFSSSFYIDLARGCAQSARQIKPIDGWLERVRARLAKVDPPNINTLHFALSAYRLGIPVLEWPAPHLQLGYGARAVVLRGSITSHTPSIGVSIAKQKAQCNALLAAAGLPVAEGGMVANLAAALEQAQRLGYPVAVKPADRDQGEGVSCDVRGDDELEQAYKHAREASPRVIVERHIEGRDFRLLFFHDRILKQIERRPGSVTGNGRDSVAALIRQLNAERAATKLKLYPIEIDEEAHLMLRRRGMTLQSVPAQGELVQLRRAANFSLGGTVKLIEEEIHPDNLELARRAMRVLRLDLAGLDLILPDIGRSWRETGGAVCEVNAQPFIGETIREDSFAEVLADLVEGEGRIPVVLVIGTLKPAVLKVLGKRIPGLAVVDADGARVSGTPLTVPGLNWVAACQAALFDPRASAALFILGPEVKGPHPSPADRYSAAYVLGAGGAKPLDELPRFQLALLRRAGANVAATPANAALLAEAGLAGREIDPASVTEELIAALG